jgi:paraquat-inducible protein B
MTIQQVDPPSAPAGPPARAPENAPRRPGRWLALVGLAILTSGLVAWAGQRRLDRGAQVRVSFHAAHGLKHGSPVRCRGVRVGTVQQVVLAEGLAGVEVVVRLSPEAASLARGGSRWWIAHPVLDWSQGVRGLDTALGDAYLEVLPGDGEPARAFRGDEAPPQPAPPPGSRSVRVWARHRRGGLRPGAPVTCRGIAVGRVQGVALAADGQRVQADLSVEPKYAHLIQRGARFRLIEPVVFEGNLMSASVQLNPEALAGGVALEPPATPGPPLEANAEVELLERAPRR